MSKKLITPKTMKYMGIKATGWDDSRAPIHMYKMQKGGASINIAMNRNDRSNVKIQYDIAYNGENIGGSTDSFPALAIESDKKSALWIVNKQIEKIMSDFESIKKIIAD